jgi:hypothetical protein
LTSIDGSNRTNQWKGSDFGGKKDILKSKWEVKASETLIYLFFQRWKYEVSNSRSNNKFKFKVTWTSTKHTCWFKSIWRRRFSRDDVLANDPKRNCCQGKDFYTKKLQTAIFNGRFFVCLTTYRKEGDLDYKLKSRINLFHADINR